MSIALSAVALLLLTGEAGQAAPPAQTPAAQTPSATQTAPRPAPAAPAADLTRNLNSGPPRPAEYLAPPPAPAEADEEEAAAPPAGTTPATTRPPATRPTTGATTTPPATAARPPASAPATSAPTTSTRPPAAAAPATTSPRPTTTAPAAPATSARPTTTAPATTTRPPAAAAPAAPTTARPATAAAPPAPGVTVLDAVARADLPFSVDLPDGFEIVTGRPGSDFRIYTIRRDERSYVMIYAGPASQFPIYSGDVVEAGGRASVVTNEGGQRRALEHLFQRPNAPREIHVWTMSLDGADRALAERIAGSVDLQ